MNYSKRIVLLLLFILYISLSSSQAATISGIAKYDGETPTFKPIKMDADPICLSKHAAPIMPENLALGDGNTLGNVFVRI